MTVAEQVKAEEKLGEALESYAGRWVAVRDHSVIADSDTLEGLLEQIEGQEGDIEVFQVAEDNSVCFY